jgi:hypothetical protein
MFDVMMCVYDSCFPCLCVCMTQRSRGRGRRNIELRRQPFLLLSHLYLACTALERNNRSVSLIAVAKGRGIFTPRSHDAIPSCSSTQPPQRPHLRLPLCTAHHSAVAITAHSLFLNTAYGSPRLLRVPAASVNLGEVIVRVQFTCRNLAHHPSLPS